MLLDKEDDQLCFLIVIGLVDWLSLQCEVSEYMQCVYCVFVILIGEEDEEEEYMVVCYFYELWDMVYKLEVIEYIIE